jgi:peptidoglycan hydrolase CwlO-like protein
MKKAIIIISILVVVGILGFVAYSFLASSKVPQAFIDKHNEVAALDDEASQLGDLNGMPEMDAMNKQMESEDYSGASKSIEAALGRKKEAASKLSSIDDKLVELTTLSAGISDAKIKASADKFIDISQKENSAKISYDNLQIQMLEKLKTMVGILVKNSKAISAADEKTVNDLSKQIDDIGNQIDSAKIEVDKVQSQYKEAEKEFFGLAGLETGK